MIALIRDRKSAVHPLCGGLLVWEDHGIYRCTDCHKLYEVVGMGNAENEFILEEKHE